MPYPILGYRVLAALVACLALAGDPAGAQGVWRGFRLGIGLDSQRELAGMGQLEIISYGEGRGSAELALVGVRAGIFEEYRASKGTLNHQYADDTDVTGLGLVASYLFGHFPNDRGPYLALGLGLGLFDVDWLLASPTDFQLDTPTASGWETREDRVILGTIVNLGLGLQLHRNADLRAQLFTLLVSTTELREDLKLVPALTLSAGVGF